MPSDSLFGLALHRMQTEFVSAGHTSLEGPGADESHRLHDLWLEARDLLECYCPIACESCWNGIDSRELDEFRATKLDSLLLVEFIQAEIRRQGKTRKLEEKLEGVMPRHAEMLFLRFATSDQRDNIEINRLLTICDSLHLWQIPRPTTDDVDVPGCASSDGAATEPDSIEAALKLGLGDTERRVKALQDAKKELQRKLAIVEEAETAVLNAQDAIEQAQKAMTQSDLALLASQMVSLAMDRW